MKRIALLLWICCFSLPITAQKNMPKWMDKARKAVVLITTYDKDNRKITSGNGFLISETGEVLSAYTVFKGASRATVTDTEGKTYPVTRIVGADELYDVIRFHISVPKKMPFLPLVTATVPVGRTAYLLPYSTEKQVSFRQGEVLEATKLKENYSYYKLGFPLESAQANTPVVLETGEVFGLAQEDASGKNEVSYAVSAAYINSLQVTSTDALNSVYHEIEIKKAWPSNLEDAAISLFLMGNQQDAKTYLETLNDFIDTFPNAADGYQNRASHVVTFRAALATTPEEQKRYLDMAMGDYDKAAQFSQQKGEVFYNQAKAIYAVAVEDSTLNDPNWTVENAVATLEKAIAMDDLPVYRQLQGDIFFFEGDYERAFQSYQMVNESELATASSYYLAAKAKENLPGANIYEIIEWLDKAIDRAGMTSEGAAYVLERIDKRQYLNQYTEMVADYDLYYRLVHGQVNASFYFYREQAKFRTGDMEGALADIQQAIRMEHDNPDYYAEEAAIYTRLEAYEKALESVQQALDLAPDFSACYRIRGVCHIRQDKKNEACEAFAKAKELGDPLVDRLIKEHCQ
ncbi:MAG: tetratricopeptide repeat-containing serine protease family protein [Tannerellaceae bacterium]|nr:tetratricopeptide repeat-containing serine protease family protein [Tannerellaceae bacterium]